MPNVQQKLNKWFSTYIVYKYKLVDVKGNYDVKFSVLDLICLYPRTRSK